MRTSKRSAAEPQAPAPVKKRSREKVAHRVARDIVQAMYDEGMEAGHKFMSESEAMVRLNVSRGTLRETLRFLQILGVLDIRPGLRGGTFVDKPNHTHLASTLALLLQFSGATMLSLIEARGAIEPGMAEMAARNATKDDIERMDEALADMSANLKRYDPYHRAHMQFWNALAQSTRNAVFIFLSPALREITHTARVVPDEKARAIVIERTKSVRDAVEARDPVAANERMRQISDSYRKTWRTTYAPEGARTISWADIALALDI